MEQEKIVEEITTLKGSMKTAFNRLDGIDDKLSAIEEKQDIMHEMNTNIKLIAQNQENQGKEITSIKADVKDLKDKPAKLWNVVVAAVITLIVSGIGGFILGKILGG